MVLRLGIVLPRPRMHRNRESRRKRRSRRSSRSSSCKERVRRKVFKGNGSLYGSKVGRATGAVLKQRCRLFFLEKNSSSRVIRAGDSVGRMVRRRRMTSRSFSSSNSVLLGDLARSKMKAVRKNRTKHLRDRMTVSRVGLRTKRRKQKERVCILPPPSALDLERKLKAALQIWKEQTMVVQKNVAIGTTLRCRGSRNRGERTGRSMDRLSATRAKGNRTRLSSRSSISHSPRPAVTVLHSIVNSEKLQLPKDRSQCNTNPRSVVVLRNRDLLLDGTEDPNNNGRYPNNNGRDLSNNGRGVSFLRVSKDRRVKFNGLINFLASKLLCNSNSSIRTANGLYRVNRRSTVSPAPDSNRLTNNHRRVREVHSKEDHRMVSTGNSTDSMASLEGMASTRDRTDNRARAKWWKQSSHPQLRKS